MRGSFAMRSPDRAFVELEVLTVLKTRSTDLPITTDSWREEWFQVAHLIGGIKNNYAHSGSGEFTRDIRPVGPLSVISDIMVTVCISD